MYFIRKLLGGRRWYQALAFAYDEYQRHQDRTEKSKFLAYRGENSTIFPRVGITHPSRVRIGKWSTIQSDTLLASMGGIYIGDYVGIGYGTTIISFTHNYRNSKSIPYDDKVFLQPVIIRDFAWIGWNARIMPGIEIGEGSIVSMGAVVTKDVPSRAIVLGNPAQEIGYRSEKHFENCKSGGHYNSVRILEEFGQFKESIPLMVKRKYAAELKELGLLKEEE
ncbi:acyltransferase [Desulfofustis glycolicus]|uniref:Transferase hexapeptide (Six repeat-containing protein) n=1 Tax=Desulfofustis glycolicus DSM 9705 TaxID=1121409 RepID=A0A1M5YT32_9BACT|nr:acyltransferase [Desulfofustis glycolicus]SHI15129.1 transferase hexapeptide (six repeat-containing protein) [Desulfofustis glycolicus DSM 9705]